MKHFRIKFILKDGRRIYPTDGGKFQLVDSNALSSPATKSILKNGAYTSSLMLFVPGASGDDFVGISKAVLEPRDSPVDRAAFILGGAMATTLEAPPN